MAYVFKDKDFHKLEEVIGKLLDSKGRNLTDVEQKSLGAALLILVSRAKHAEDLGAPDTILGDEIEMGILKSSAAFQSLLKRLTNEHGGVFMGNYGGIPWFFADDMAPDAVGIIPTFIRLGDKRPLVKQIDSRYVSGWHKFEGFKFDKRTWSIKYPDDPPYPPLAGAALNGELVCIYPSGWTMVMDAKNNIEIARLD